MQREDLNPYEKALGVRTLIDNYGLTQEEVAKALNALVDKGNRPNLTLGNDGDVYVRNRAARRKRPVVDRNFTKSTHKDKKLRSKNAKR